MSGTYKLDGALFERNPLTKIWARQQVAVHGSNEPIFTDFWRFDMSFGWLESATEMNFFESAFLDGGEHTAELPHPENGLLTGFSGLFVADFTFDFNDIDRNKYAVGARLVLEHISMPDAPGPSSEGLDVIEANFHGAWLESYFTYGGPDEAASLDEVKFFDC